MACVDEVCFTLSNDQNIPLSRYQTAIAIPLESLPIHKIEDESTNKACGKRKMVSFNIDGAPPSKRRCTEDDNVVMTDNYDEDDEDDEDNGTTEVINVIMPCVAEYSCSDSNENSSSISELELFSSNPYCMDSEMDIGFSKESQSNNNTQIKQQDEFVENIAHLDHSELVEIIKRIKDVNPTLVESAFKNNLPKTITPSNPLLSQNCEFDWNDKFQKAMDEIQNLTPNSSILQQEKAYHQLANLSTDFIYTVKTYARIIISEAYLPDDQKIIKPVDVGGIAGGSKYIVQRILFKFAIDHKGIHRDEFVASKIAGHELKSLSRLINCKEPGIRFPMMALVDYRGFRVIGMSLLPVNGEKSLIHGSCDGAKSVRYHPLVAPKLQTIARKLNLAPHQIGDVLMHLPVDLEVHCPVDEMKRFSQDTDVYLLDFSRLFPPESPEKNRKMDYLYKLLRPELVTQYNSPLCSDAFSNFIKPPSNIKDKITLEKKKLQESLINKTVSEATKFLKNNLVREVGVALCSIQVSERADINLPNFFHSHGVNLRYMGQVRIFVSRTQNDQYWSRIILIEMLSRVIKDFIRKSLQEKMKEIKHPGEGAYRREIVNILNTLFGETYHSKIFWITRIYPLLVDKYYNSEFKSIGSSLKDEIKFVNQDGQDGRWILLQRTVQALGLQFANSSWIYFNGESSDQLFSCPKPFEQTDLAEMKGKVKFLDIVDLANGFVLKTKAIMNASSQEERKRLLTLAISSFESALDSHPTNIVSLYNLADCLMLVNSIDRSREYYRKALLLENRNPVALFKYGLFKEFTDQYDSASKYYRLSITAFPNYAICHVVYADLLVHHYKQYDKAEYHYKQALQADPLNEYALNNYAIFLLKIRQNIDLAGEIFEKAITVSNNEPNPIHLRNFIAFLTQIKKNEKKANIYENILQQSSIRSSNNV